MKRYLYCMMNDINLEEANNIIRFKFYIEGIEQSKIQEIEEFEKNYDEEQPYNAHYEYQRYWDNWWETNADLFQNYIEREYYLKKVENETKSILEFENGINNIIKDKNKYEVSYEYKMVGLTKIQIDILIKSFNQENEKYDIDLENIKLNLKDFWIKLLKRYEKESNIVSYKCFWIQDTQSLELSNKAYREINIIENYLRSFMSDVLSLELGVEWHNIMEKTSFYNKFSSRYNKYRKKIKSFANIDDFLLLIDSDDLYKIMDYKKKRVLVKEPNEELYSLLEEIKSQRNVKEYVSKTEKLIEKVEKKYIEKTKSIWDQFFSRFFDVKNVKHNRRIEDVNIHSNFKMEWQEFCEFRNHIAHNKFIDYEFYKDLMSSIETIKNKIDEALKDFLSENEHHNNPLIGEEVYEYTYKNKEERESIIYNEIIDFTQRLIECIGMNDKKVFQQECFRIYEKASNDFLNEFKMYLNNIVNVLDTMKIIVFENKNKYILQMTKEKGKVSSYLIEFLINEKCIEKTVISHTGYGFECNGYGEIRGDGDNSEYYRLVIGTSWDYWNDFKRDVENIIKNEFIQEVEKNTSEFISINDLIF